jgi:hypothetical protein
MNCTGQSQISCTQLRRAVSQMAPRFVLATMFVGVPIISACAETDAGPTPSARGTSFAADYPNVAALQAPDIVSPAAYKQSTDPDDTASIQRAIDTCKTVQLSANETYRVSSTLYLCNGGHQKIAGFGRSTILKVSRGFSGRTACSDSAENHWNAVFANFNCGSTNIVDEDIEFADFTLDNRANIEEERSLIGIFNRSTEHVFIHGIFCNTFADCTATLHSSDTLIVDSVASNSLNAGFDAWDSPRNMTVRDTLVYCNTATASYGLLYNASNTNNTEDGVAANLMAIRNKQFNCAPGIFIDPLTTNGLVREVNVVENFEDNSNLSTGFNGGIGITGHVTQVTIRGAILRNMSRGQLYVGTSGVPNDRGIPDHVRIVNPHFTNVSNPGGSLVDIIISNHTNTATGVVVKGGTYTSAYETKR